jgi:hypothetical protein
MTYPLKAKGAGGSKMQLSPGYLMICAEGFDLQAAIPLRDVKED